MLSLFYAFHTHIAIGHTWSSQFVGTLIGVCLVTESVLPCSHPYWLPYLTAALKLNCLALILRNQDLTEL
jgi:hypothetical protein